MKRGSRCIKHRSAHSGVERAVSQLFCCYRLECRAQKNVLKKNVPWRRAWQVLTVAAAARATCDKFTHRLVGRTSSTCSCRLVAQSHSCKVIWPCMDGTP